MKPGKVDFSLAGKVALVTGSSRGIGKGDSPNHSAYRANVAVNCIQGVEQAETVASSIRRLGRKAIVAKGDVSKVEEVNHLVKKVVNQLGLVDILVNNAGVASSCWLHEISFEEGGRNGI